MAGGTCAAGGPAGTGPAAGGGGSGCTSEPQYRHRIAAAWMVSAQYGHVFVVVGGGWIAISVTSLLVDLQAHLLLTRERDHDGDVSTGQRHAHAALAWRPDRQRSTQNAANVAGKVAAVDARGLFVRSLRLLFVQRPRAPAAATGSEKDHNEHRERGEYHPAGDRDPEP
jgi:hypothetical protein